MNYRNIFLSIVAGFLGAAFYLNYFSPSTVQENSDKLRAEYYSVENAVHVSPHGLRKKMDSGDNSYILVDLRSQEEYEEEHVVGAINIPAYKDRDHSDYGAVERIVGDFKKLPIDKEIIVYCYSTACMTGRKVGDILAKEGIFVKHLNIGWNEWRYDWNSWNHPHEWETTKAEDYVVTGSQPGTPKLNEDSKSCPIDGALGC